MLFLSNLRTLLQRVEGEESRASTIVLVSDTAFTALFATMGALFSAPAFVLLDAGHKFTLDPNTFRMVNDLASLAFMAAFILFAPLAFTVGVLAWRTRFLPRWLAVASFVAGVCCLASVVWFPSFLVVAWVLLLSGYLVLRGEVGVTTARTAEATA